MLSLSKISLSWISLSKMSLMDFTFFLRRTDAQRAAKLKENKEKELEHCAFNAEQIEDSSHAQSLVRINVGGKMSSHFVAKIKSSTFLDMSAKQPPPLL